MLNDTQRLDCLERNMNQMQKQMTTMLNDWHRLIAMSNATRPLGYGGMPNAPFGAGYYGGSNGSRHDLFTTFNPYFSAGETVNPNSSYAQGGAAYRPFQHQQPTNFNNFVYFNFKNITPYFQVDGVEDQFVKVIQTALLLCSGDIKPTMKVFNELRFINGPNDNDESFLVLFRSLVALNSTNLVNTFLTVEPIPISWFAVDVLPSLQLALIHGYNDQTSPERVIVVDLIPLINKMVTPPLPHGRVTDTEQRLAIKLRNFTNIVKDITLEGVMVRIMEKLYGDPSTDGTIKPETYSQFLQRPELVGMFSQYK